MNAKHILSSKIVIGGMLVLLAIFVNLKFHQWQQQRDIENLKNNLKQQAAALEQKNRDISDSIQYLNSDDFKERVARQQLNLKKDGEVVYTFSQAPTATPAVTFAQNDQKQGNISKWWHYFFADVVFSETFIQ